MRGKTDRLGQRVASQGTVSVLSAPQHFDGVSIAPQRVAFVTILQRAHEVQIGLRCSAHARGNREQDTRPGCLGRIVYRLVQAAGYAVTGYLERTRHGDAAYGATIFRV